MLNAHKDTDKGGEISELGGRDFSQYKNRGKIIFINTFKDAYLCSALKYDVITDNVYITYKGSSW